MVRTLLVVIGRSVAAAELRTYAHQPAVIGWTNPPQSGGAYCTNTDEVYAKKKKSDLIGCCVRNLVEVLRSRGGRYRAHLHQTWKTSLSGICLHVEAFSGNSHYHEFLGQPVTQDNSLCDFREDRVFSVSNWRRKLPLVAGIPAGTSMVDPADWWREKYRRLLVAPVALLSSQTQSVHAERNLMKIGLQCAIGH